MTRINVTKPFLSPPEEYISYLQRIWENGQLTNHGPLLKVHKAEFKVHKLKASALGIWSCLANGIKLSSVL